MQMDWSSEVASGIDVTGVITRVEHYDGSEALVVLSSGISVVVPAAHKPASGDSIVEGELSI